MREFLSELFRNTNFIMLTVSISYILGLYAFFTDLPILFSLIFTLLIIGLIIKINNVKLPIIYLLVFYLAFFYSSYRVKPTDELSTVAPAECSLIGQVSSVSTNNGDGKIKFYFDVNKIKINSEISDIKGKTLVVIKLDKSEKLSKGDYLIGNCYELKGKLRKPFTAVNPSQFAYDKYLRNFNIYTTFYSTNSDVEQITTNLSLKYKLLQYLNIKRENIIDAHSKYLKSPNIEILGGIVFGDDAIAPPDYIKTSFIHSGLLHILAASGMNVAFISSFLFFFLIRLGVPYKVRIICGILTIIFYALMTGLGASVIRASLMLIFILIGKLINRDTHSISLLSFVAILMLIYNPAYINDVGFQLSFIVTFGILISADAIMKYFKFLPLWLTGSIFIPIIAQAWVIPIQMFYFNTISVYSVFANIVSMPILSIISFGGFISSVFALCPFIADFVCRIFDIVLNPCLKYLVIISEFFSNLPHSLYITTHPSILQILCYYLILLIFIYLLHSNFESKKTIIATSSLCLLLFLSTIIKLPNNNFEVISFDVGNADAFLLKTPQNHYYIIDTGKTGYDGGRSQADIIILKYLKDKGIKHIDGMILTHFDSDHSGGATDLIDNLSIDKVYVNSLVDKKRLAKTISNDISKTAKTEKVLAKNSQVISHEKVRGKDFCITLIKPDLRGTLANKSDNENSIITLVSYNKNTMLFMGDAGIPALEKSKQILPHGVTVYKVGHHGAKGVINKELFDYLSPKISLVSVGINKYGHPSPVTVKILEKSKVVRTDKINAIKVVFRVDNRYEVDGFNSTTHKFYKRIEGII